LSHQFETFRKGQGVVAEATSLAFPQNACRSVLKSVRTESLKNNFKFFEKVDEAHFLNAAQFF